MCSRLAGDGSHRTMNVLAKVHRILRAAGLALLLVMDAGSVSARQDLTLITIQRGVTSLNLSTDAPPRRFASVRISTPTASNVAPLSRDQARQFLYAWGCGKRGLGKSSAWKACGVIGTTTIDAGTSLKISTGLGVRIVITSERYDPMVEFVLSPAEARRFDEGMTRMAVQLGLV